MKGLFINTPRAACSIYESGLMIFHCIKDSRFISFDYIEISPDNLSVPGDYDIYLFNYHFITTGWLDTRSIKKLPGMKGVLILEMLPNDPFVYCSPFHFDFYCVLDPSMTFRHKKVFVFPRPLEEYQGKLSDTKHEIPIIGSFGFATKGKGFEHVVEAVNKEFDKAIVRINIPYGTYTDPGRQYANELARRCISLAKSGIEVQITHHYMSKEELIYWCSENTLNCFLYDRNMPGLAATTDQAIISERPLAVSDNSTFRHIIKYLTPYPKQSLKESIETSADIVKKIKKEWSSQNFLLTFESMLMQISCGKRKENNSRQVVMLKRKKHNLISVKREVLLNKLIRLYYKSPLYAALNRKNNT